MANANPPPPPPQINLPTYPEFIVTDDPEVASKWEEWLEGFESMVAAMRVTTEKDKRNMLFYYLGSATRKVIKRLDGVSPEDAADCYTSLRTALNNYFKPKLNRVYGMNMLQQVIQQQGESIDNYLLRVKEKVAAIEIEKLDKQGIIDLITLAHLVNNCKNKHVKHKAIRDDLSLAEFMKTARAAERAEYQLKDMEASGTTVNAVSKGQKSQNPKNQQGKPRGRSKSRNDHRRSKSASGKKTKECWKCGGPYPHQGDCPATNEECHKCGYKGHYMSKCHTKDGKSKRKVSTVTEEDKDYITVPVIAAINEHDPKTKWATVCLQNSEIKAMIDSGSEINIVGEETFRGLPHDVDQLSPATQKFCGYGPEGKRVEIPILGSFQCMVKAPLTKRQTVSTVYVLKGKATNLLSCNTAEKLGLVQFACKVEPMDNIDELYKDRFEGIGKMKNTKVELAINKDVKPVAQKPRRVPFHVRGKVDEELERLKELDIIEDASGPTPWISPLVIVHKDNGSLRVCVDSRMINTAIERERYPMNTIEELIVELNGAKFFSKIDLNKGYHQLELSEESRYITTFATHSGLYRYKRLCFGINSAAEVFQKAVADMLQGIPGVKNMSDDIIVFSKTHEEHEATIKKVMDRLREFNVTANRDKCEFFKREITFFGHVFSDQGISPSEEKISAVVNATPPQTKEEVKSLLGMAQYVSRFIPNYSATVEPLRVLTKQDEPWRWGKQEKEAFQSLKTSMADWKMIEYFDMTCPTELVVDASPCGLGAMLTQKKSDGSLSVVEYASRKLSDTESRYSQTEREALGVVWATEHFDHYLLGAEFKVITDHKPLEGIMNKPMSKPTARLERLCLRLQPYKVQVEYRPGKSNPADYFSRHPQKCEQVPTKTWLDVQTEQMCINAVQFYSLHHEQSISMEEMVSETAKDGVLKEVMACIATQQWHKLENEFTSYKRVKNELSISNGLLLRGDRVVLPKSLQSRAVKLAHAGHQGIVKTKSLLRETVWFPGIDNMVEKAVSDCLPCQSSIPKSSREPLQMTPLPDGPWKEVAVDFTGPFAGGEYLLVVIDEYSRFPEVEIVYSTSANAVIPKLDAIFARQGIPEVVKSDNGPPFNGEQFSSWAKYIGFAHRRVTPLWPEANGEAERFMRTLGKAIRTAKVDGGNWKQEIFMFLRHYRATPHSSTGLSPAEMLNGRKLRTEVPNVSKKKTVTFQDRVDLASRKDERVKAYIKDLADHRRKAKDTDIAIGDSVLIKQPKENKLSTPFKPVPYKVIEKKGSMITAQHGSHIMTRNSSLMKKVSSECGKGKVIEEDPIVNLDDFDIHLPDTDNTSVTPQSPTKSLIPNPNTPRKPESTVSVRESKRARKPPNYLKDYVN